MLSEADLKIIHQIGWNAAEFDINEEYGKRLPEDEHREDFANIWWTIEEDNGSSLEKRYGDDQEAYDRLEAEFLAGFREHPGTTNPEILKLVDPEILAWIDEASNDDEH